MHGTSSGPLLVGKKAQGRLRGRPRSSKKISNLTLTGRACCCGRKKPVTSVSGVCIQGHKDQIICLVGPNDSGEATKSHMTPNLLSLTDDTISIDDLPRKPGSSLEANW